jgi:hypothetical protein
MADVHHLSFPLRLAPDGDFVTVEQGTPEEVAEQVRALVSTPPGWSDEPGLEEMGLEHQAFLQGGANADEIERVIVDYVPDFAGAVSERPDVFDESLRHVGVEVRGA